MGNRVEKMLIKSVLALEMPKRVEWVYKLYILIRAGIGISIPALITLLLWIELYSPIVHDL